jgi:hypothetical protein
MRIKKYIKEAVDNANGKLIIEMALTKLTTEQLVETLNNAFSKIFLLFYKIQNTIHPVEKRLSGESIVKEVFESDTVSYKLNEIDEAFKYAKNILGALNQRKLRGDSTDLLITEGLLADLKNRVEILNRFIDTLRAQKSTWFDVPQIKPNDPRLANNTLTNEQKFQKAYFNLMNVIDELKTVTKDFKGLEDLTFPIIENKMTNKVINALNIVFKKPPKQQQPAPAST